MSDRPFEPGQRISLREHDGTIRDAVVSLLFAT